MLCVDEFLDKYRATLWTLEEVSCLWKSLRLHHRHHKRNLYNVYCEVFGSSRSRSYGEFLDFYHVYLSHPDRSDPHYYHHLFKYVGTDESYEEYYQLLFVCMSRLFMFAEKIHEVKDSSSKSIQRVLDQILHQEDEREDDEDWLLSWSESCLDDYYDHDHQHSSSSASPSKKQSNRGKNDRYQ